MTIPLRERTCLQTEKPRLVMDSSVCRLTVDLIVIWLLVARRSRDPCRRRKIRSAGSTVPTASDQRGGCRSGRAALQHHPGRRHRHTLRLLPTHRFVRRLDHVSRSAESTGARDQAALPRESVTRWHGKAGGWFLSFSEFRFAPASIINSS